MLYSNVQILGLAHVDAPGTLTSSEIENRLEPAMNRLGISSGILEKLSGIVSRRTFDLDFPPSEGAAQAAEKAMNETGVDRSEIGVVVNTSVCRDYVEPSTASLVHAKLGLGPRCLNFDLGNACLAFINGMEMVATMIERGQIERGIVVDCENTTYALTQTIKRLLDPRSTWETFKENFATLTLGCGAVAMILGRSEHRPDEHRFLGGVTVAATQYNRLCCAQVDSMITNTKKLFHHGMEVGLKTWEIAKNRLGWMVEDLDHFVIHQVGKAHTETFARVMGIDLRKIFRLYPGHGNIGPAGVPITLSKMISNGRVQPGDRIALMGIGSGINCTMAEVVW